MTANLEPVQLRREHQGKADLSVRKTNVIAGTLLDKQTGEGVESHFISADLLNAISAHSS